MTDVTSSLISERLIRMNDQKTKNLQRLSNNEANRITREALCTALLYLMETKSFEEIRISELTRKAGVSRQAFYRNYSSKQDIVMEIESELLDRFSGSLTNTKYDKNIFQWFCDYFSFIRDNRKAVRALLASNLFDHMLSRFPKAVEERFMNTANYSYYALGSISAIRSISAEWIKNGMNEEIRTMAEICTAYDLMHLFRKDERSSGTIQN